MKCRACGSDDVTQSKGQCNECRWIYDHQQKLKEEAKKLADVKMSNIFDFLDEESKMLEKFKRYWIVNHKNNPETFPLAVSMDNAGTWFEQYLNWRESNE